MDTLFDSLYQFLKTPAVTILTPIVATLAAIGATFATIIAAIAAVTATKPNSREKTDILKCEVLNLLCNSHGLETWIKYIALGQSTYANLSKLLDIQWRKKSKLNRIFKVKHYSKYAWTIHLVAALAELQKEGYNIPHGEKITPDAYSQWSYEASSKFIRSLGVPESEIDNYIKRIYTN